MDNLEIDLLQNFRSYLKLLNFALILAALLFFCVGLDQLAETVCKKPGWATQKLPNLNILHPGIEVWMVTTHGV
jgi:hypothetical protein